MIASPSEPVHAPKRKASVGKGRPLPTGRKIQGRNTFQDRRQEKQP